MASQDRRRGGQARGSPLPAPDAPAAGRHGGHHRAWACISSPCCLRELRASQNAANVDWAAVERLSRYGGIRIEDDVACRAAGEAPENLTRDAFASVA